MGFRRQSRRGHRGGIVGGGGGVVALETPYTVSGLAYWLDPRRHAEVGTPKYTYAGMSAVTATGTTPPTLTLTGGPPTEAINLRVTITAGGALGVATYQYSLDGGATIRGSGVTSANEDIFGNITLTFGTGTYNVNNVYTANVLISAAPSRESPTNVIDATKTVAQATAANQPQLIRIDSQINNQPCLKFLGAQRILSPTWGAAVTTPTTQYWVVICDLAASNSCFGDGISIISQALFANSANQLCLYSGGTQAQVPVGVTPSTSWRIVCSTVDTAGNGTLYVTESVTPKVVAVVGASNVVSRKFGELANGVFQATARVAMNLVYSGLHDAPTRTTIMQYLSSLFGIATTNAPASTEAPYTISGLAYWLDPRKHADTLGKGFTYAALGPVTATGTTPPTVTTTGTATQAVNLRIEITTGGDLGVGVFRYSLNGGVSYTAGQTLAASFGPVAGITIQFAAGTYATDNVYVANVLISAAPSRESAFGDIDATKTAAQATGSLQPELIMADAQVGNRPTLKFASKRFLTPTWSVPVTTPTTQYWVVIQDVASSTGCFSDGTSVISQALFSNSSNQLCLYSAGTQAQVPPGVTPSTSWRVVCGTVDAAGTGTLYVTDSATAKVSASVGATNIVNRKFGELANGVFVGTGYRIAASLIYSGLHDATQRSTIMQFLGGLYGITVTP